MEALAGDLERGVDAVRFAEHLGFVPEAWQARVLAQGRQAAGAGLRPPDGEEHDGGGGGAAQDLSWPFVTLRTPDASNIAGRPRLC
jgi:hypothetical protein